MHIHTYGRTVGLERANPRIRGGRRQAGRQRPRVSVKRLRSDADEPAMSTTDRTEPRALTHAAATARADSNSCSGIGVSSSQVNETGRDPDDEM